MKKIILISLMILALAGCSTSRQPLPQISDDLRKTLTRYLEENYKTPEEYVISKFKDHDIVFLGEFHRIKHDVELIHKLIPLLYENGIHSLGIEFARYADQADIDRLINAEVYDEKLAQKMLFNFLVTWGYQEYADIFQTAWNLNRQLPEGAEKFRIVGLNATLDWSYVKTGSDLENPDVMKKVNKDGDSDEVMANTIIKEFVNKGKKALIYSGMYHAFTKYQLPTQLFKDKKNLIQDYNSRMGNRIYKQIGDRCFTICLHAPWPSENNFDICTYPADGIIDALMRDMDQKYRRVGFDVTGGPFADITGNTSYWKHGYEGFNLGMYCDGYIFQKPLSEYEGVRAIKDFVNADNLSEVRAQSPNPASRNMTADNINEGIKNDANIKSRIRMFE